MTQVPTLPLELLATIAKYLKPHTPIIGHDAAWIHPGDTLNWWDGPHWRSRSGFRVMDPPNAANDSPGDGPLAEIAVSPYASLLALRQVDRSFDSICTPLLYNSFNCLGHGLNEDITTEVVSRYHCYFRTVRIVADPEQGSPSERMTLLIIPHLSEGVTSLGVYFDDSNACPVEVQECGISFDDIIGILNKGNITSFGIYTSSAFSKQLEGAAPTGVSTLLERIATHNSVSAGVKSLDIVTEGIDTGSYDRLRAQIVKLRSLTIRGALQYNLGPVWDNTQRDKWFACQHLTNLQLIQCEVAAAPHVPYILQFFPSLRTLTMVACGDDDDEQPPRNEKGQGFTKDSLWRDRVPLESFHLEHVFEWEITVLGVIHTRQLTITAIIDAGLIAPFRDEDLFPQLRILRTENQYMNSDLAAICARRGIIVDSNARPLLFYE